MARYDAESIRQMVPSVSDEKLNQAVSKGALKLSDAEIETVSFVFWLCYLAERDLGDSISTAWNTVKASLPEHSVDTERKALNEFVFGKKTIDSTLEENLNELPEKIANKIRTIVKENYQEKRIIGIEELPYFIDKIKVFEARHGKDEATNILYKLNQIRNDLSHYRIKELSYEKQSLFERKTKEKLLVDYLQAMTNLTI